ncbi:MAG: SDR family oxidoreductase [Pseudomonadota bacterium]|nr:SDR family oxidoreductase [Pseudomonadota bacterium]
MSHEEKIALVTGGNRGIGLEICRQLLQLNIKVILTSRDLAKGSQAQQRLAHEQLTVQPLDVTDDKQIAQLNTFIKQHYGRLDILINNAGVFPDKITTALDSSVDHLRQAMETNLYGPFRLCQSFIPLMRQQNYGRIVNLSSGMGQLSEMNGCCPGYRTSKTALNALTRLLADELRGSNVLINALCPGWVRTEMGGEQATREVTEGADTAIWLATLPDGGPSGGFFRDRKPIPW